MRRFLNFLVRNWPLKIAAIGLATVLYAGFVVSRGTEPLEGPIPITPIGLAEDATVVEQLPSVDQISYTVVGSNLGLKLTPADFVAEVDLTSVPRDRPVPVGVRVRSSIGGVVVTGVSPATVNLTVETVESKPVPVRIVVAPLPPDVDAGIPVVTPDTVVVRGARSFVSRVEAVTETITVEPAGLDIDRAIPPVPVDASGTTVPLITVEPRTVLVQLDVISDAESRGMPIAAVVTGEPAPGYHIAGLEVTPMSVSVVGDADDLQTLVAVNTQPIVLAGETASLTRAVALDLPPGVLAPSVEQVTVRVRIEQRTDNRTYNAALELVGRDPTLSYEFSVSQVTVALFGSVLELDEVGAAPLLAELDVTGLGPGTHVVAAIPLVSPSLTVSASTPSSVSVTIVAATATASPGSGTSPAP